ncbi:ATP-dependent helicase [Deinococcus cellulosilyticus]|uniref:DNA 3'-5' helicase n=1 Tax=Deinococcus cellulosilyticus (strain DSM 18568 / NBRC 106333 / KACC 11606 / 5516J-15) TaxID=1223518 RepID=A0A511MXX6_DEIC1|nr:UvrD-helicase domain-containing protein [Deinococcus cellulosilyticus]GEM45442.1 DNA helicase [Deinococcus cellulosilyticus NBRC 106333 = KACC 11606]
MDLLSQLNPNQAEAAAHYTGPALVIAGAGSGKTRTLVYRLAHLIMHHHVPPREILAVTFTNKAAAEMRERAEKLVYGASDLWMSTFHSAGVRILRAYGENIGLKRGFVILDDDDQLDLLKEIMGNIPGMPQESNPRYLRAIIDKAKSNLWTPDDLYVKGDEFMAGLRKDVAVEGYRRYESRMRGMNAIDFGDLLSETVRLFREVPEVLEKIQARARFIMIDEYQDTNTAQYEFARQLAKKERNLLVVGDPDQSIYKFRGADIKNILDFQQDYPDSKVYKLEENYRSSAKVLTIANKLIENNAERLDKTLVPVKPEGEDVWFYRATDQKFESDFIAQQITLLSHKGYKLTDMAVLYRTNAQSRVVEESLRRAQIPAKIVGGVGFYDRREIKDILAYARLAINPSDDVAFRRIVGRPKRGIGDTAVQKLLDWGSLHRKSLLEAASMADTILERGASKCQEFALLMQSLSESVDLYEPHHFLRLVIESTGYLEMLKLEGQEGLDRRENLEELLNAATDWSEQHEGGSIADFLDDAALLSSVDDEKVKRENGGVPDESVTLMTLHNAKGLEFPVVFIVGVEEGLLPSRNSLMEPGGLEEERRLFYVGITRAMDRLYLTAAENRMQYGKTNACEDSRFLEEIEGGFVPVDLYGQPATAKKRGNWSSFHPSAPSVPKSTAPSPTAVSESDGFKGGERVKHPKFGTGIVLAVAGFGDKQQVTVNFPGVGNKTLLTKFANLTRA